MRLPFLLYLTVFRSRLGLSNLVLEITGSGHQPEVTLLRKIKGIVEQKDVLDLRDPTNFRVFEYLTKEKRIISAKERKKGRYPSYTLWESSGDWEARGRSGELLEALPVYSVDVMMADKAVRSSVGVPTPDNVGEVLAFSHQLGLLSIRKNTWTAAGQLLQVLRNRTAEHGSENWFALGYEAVALLRQIIELDGLILREILRQISARPRITKDDVASEFDVVVDRALEAVDSPSVTSLEVRKARTFGKQVREAVASRSGKSRAPGVLEHRVSPRLEWLVDLGYLSKDAAGRNSFEYKVEPSAGRLLDRLDEAFGQKDWGSVVAVDEWTANPIWADLRSQFCSSLGDQAFRDAYEMLKRRIGPASLRETAFLSALISDEGLGFEDTHSALIEFARVTDGVTLSGGRYTRSPENIYMTDAALSA